MKQCKNYVGEKHGQLKVMECIVASDGTNKGGLWQCKCGCGKLINVYGYRLHSRRSCGCLIKKAAKARGKLLQKPDQKLQTNMYSRYKAKMKYVGEVAVSKSVWLETIGQPCHYCGYLDAFLLNYAEEGRSCCYQCANMKGTMPHELFVERVELIHSRLSEK